MDRESSPEDGEILEEGELEQEVQPLEASVDQVRWLVLFTRLLRPISIHQRFYQKCQRCLLVQRPKRGS